MAACAVVVGCQTLSLGGKPVIVERLQTPSPRSLAVLPTVNLTDRPEWGPVVRETLYRAFSVLPFQDVELSKVDDFLSSRALESKLAPADLQLTDAADERLADAVVYSRLTRTGRMYLLLYSHVRIDLDVVIYDTRSREALLTGSYSIRDRLYNPFLTLPGLFASSWQTLWHLRDEQFRDTLMHAAERIAAQIPTPRYELAEGVSMRLFEVQVHTARSVLRRGDRVIVHARATPNCISTFEVIGVSGTQPLVETEPGTYVGSYEIRDGDNARYTVVRIMLRRSGSGETLYYDAHDRAFAVDTEPPPRGRIAQARFLPGRGLRLEVAPIRAFSLTSSQEPIVWQVYRKQPHEVDYQRIGQTANSVFVDESLNLSLAYDYVVIGTDAAGNVGPLGPAFHYRPAAR